MPKGQAPSRSRTTPGGVGGPYEWRMGPPNPRSERRRRPAMFSKRPRGQGVSKDTGAEAPLRLLLVDDNEERVAVVERGLLDSDFDVVAVIPTAGGLLHQLDTLLPDVVLIALDSPDRDVLESLAIASHHNPRPVVMFSEADDQAFVADAIRAGVTAYQAEGINPERARTAIAVASTHFATYRELRAELDRTRQQLSDRKLVDQAKGLIMQARGVSEEEAYAALRKLAMDRQCSIGEASRDVLAILNRGPGSRA